MAPEGGAGSYGPRNPTMISNAPHILITDDQRFAQRADRTIHLFDGRVVEESLARA